MRYLQQKEVRSLLDYDPKNGQFLWKPRQPTHRGASVFNSRRAGKAAGTTRGGYLMICIFGVWYRAHRIAWVYMHGEIDNRLQIDHINGVRDDNRICNLRVVTAKENGKNQKRPTTNTSGVIGVSWSKHRKKWLAQIKIEGKAINLGGFDRKEDAVRRRMESEKEYGFHENHGRAR